MKAKVTGRISLKIHSFLHMLPYFASSWIWQVTSESLKTCLGYSTREFAKKKICRNEKKKPGVYPASLNSNQVENMTDWKLLLQRSQIHLERHNKQNQNHWRLETFQDHGSICYALLFFCYHFSVWTVCGIRPYELRVRFRLNDYCALTPA